MNCTHSSYSVCWNCEYYLTKAGRKATMFRVTAQLKYTHKINGMEWSGSRQIPAFEINGTVSDCTTETDAKNVAQRILDPMSIYGDGLSITVVKL
jgi:hypothetical protein